MKGAHTTLGERFCRRLIDIMPSPQARTLCAMELAKWAGKTLYFPAAKSGDRRLTVAGNMLTNAMSPAEAAMAIHERFGVSMRTAQRDVKAACKMSQNSVASEFQSVAFNHTTGISNGLRERNHQGD